MSEMKGNPKTFYVYADNDGSGTTTKSMGPGKFTTCLLAV